MKLNTQIKLLCSSVLLASAVSAYAVPTLQLDIESANTRYNKTTETIVTNDATFQMEAYAWGDTAPNLIDTGVWYYLSVALTPKGSNVGPAAFGDVVTLNGDTLTSLGLSMEYGKPPIETVDGELAAHGIYDTTYYEIAFQFDPTVKVATYNTQDGSAANAGTKMYAKYFDFDTSALADNYGVHFDLYTYGDTIKGKKSSTGITEFAPFSHDAEYLAGGDPMCDPTKEDCIPVCVGPNCVPTVSEPSTLLLMGAGLAALGLRKRFKK